MQDNNKEKSSTKKSKTKKSEVSKSNTSNKGSAKKEASNLMKEVFKNETQDIRAAFEAYFKRKY